MLEFEKMHALGNDFIMVDLFEQVLDDPVTFARKYLHRRFGIGGDQLILLLPSETAHVKMRIFNPDGSEAEMCGNGIRCLVDFALRRGRAEGRRISVETLAGVKTVEKVQGGYRVNMGVPQFKAETLPSVFTGEAFPAHVDVEGEKLDLYLVSMGNPHAVSFEFDRFEELAERISKDRKYFPKEVNVEFVKVESPSAIRVRVWERGAGPTLACGTGACASAVTAVRKGAVKSPVEVHLPGGTLTVEWNGEGDVYLTGPVTCVFEGKIADFT